MNRDSFRLFVEGFTAEAIRQRGLTNVVASFVVFFDLGVESMTVHTCHADFVEASSLMRAGMQLMGGLVFSSVGGNPRITPIAYHKTHGQFVAYVFSKVGPSLLEMWEKGMLASGKTRLMDFTLSSTELEQFNPDESALLHKGSNGWEYLRPQ